MIYYLISWTILILPCLTPLVKNNSSVYFPLIRNRKLSLQYMDCINFKVLPPNPRLLSFTYKAWRQTVSSAYILIHIRNSSIITTRSTPNYFYIKILYLYSVNTIPWWYLQRLQSIVKSLLWLCSTKLLKQIQHLECSFLSWNQIAPGQPFPPFQQSWSFSCTFLQLWAAAG